MKFTKNKLSYKKVLGMTQKMKVALKYISNKEKVFEADIIRTFIQTGIDEYVRVKGIKSLTK